MRIFKNDIYSTELYCVQLTDLTHSVCVSAYTFEDISSWYKVPGDLTIIVQTFLLKRE